MSGAVVRRPRWVTALWRGVAPRTPRGARLVGIARVLLRSRWDLADALAAMEDRLHAVERDADLLAAHVAALTERLGAGAEPAGAEPDDRLTAARLGAIASFEHRIGALEAGAGHRRHARLRRSAPNGARTATDGEVNGW